ncbi:DUF4136 domain-containing protein [Hymenobacter sp. BT770]|uniref:DUF4136 domain-containing protein n=1 Tax=Hymenobacter sp. BT770 TaxID=2886942 RepID=UPI001D116DE6|nr:DUF4136 domain-containing protein [Hymenobacter sp. BT770]MCC3153850.1 DUF4136 domain-containing protein [Hymenobacter sp. BT770]MDO3415994.1 DUF4136 domain-containing protein [Hymenobacter sp. BT770]
MTNSLRILLTLSLGAGLSSCITMQEARIESDYSYSGNFRRYRTYDFVHSYGPLSDTSRLGLVLRDAIQQRLQQQGYRAAAKRPDLLVNYHIFEGAVNLRGYNQEDLERWVAQHEGEADDTPEQSRQTYDPVRRLLTDGTLMVTLVDARSQRAIWNGYASGVDVPDNARAETVLRRSVRSIFDRYRILAKGYLLSPNAAETGGH